MNETFEQTRDRMYMAYPDSQCTVFDDEVSLNGEQTHMGWVEIVCKGVTRRFMWTRGAASRAMAKHEAMCFMRLMLSGAWQD